LLVIICWSDPLQQVNLANFSRRPGLGVGVMFSRILSGSTGSGTEDAIEDTFCSYFSAIVELESQSLGPPDG